MWLVFFPAVHNKPVKCRHNSTPAGSQATYSPGSYATGSAGSHGTESEGSLAADSDYIKLSDTTSPVSTTVNNHVYNEILPSSDDHCYDKMDNCSERTTSPVYHSVPTPYPVTDSARSTEDPLVFSPLSPLYHSSLVNHRWDWAFLWYWQILFDFNQSVDRFSLYWWEGFLKKPILWLYEGGRGFQNKTDFVVILSAFS